MKLLKVLIAVFQGGKDGEEARDQVKGAKDISVILVMGILSSLGYMAEKQVEAVTDELKKISKSVDGMEKSMGELNTKMAVVVTEQKGLKISVDDHETRLREVERRKD